MDKELQFNFLKEDINKLINYLEEEHVGYDATLISKYKTSMSDNINLNQLDKLTIIKSNLISIIEGNKTL